eukprot:gnl/TRDRNA2_/TRDRNA2_34811_c0_seq1.p1 gnl/TRDRNA2_/TRDRNA2_34811_c0~~gnl/TRDRNA2_/TRDRNA2_34811_c0_seq1.p1  ORF type:complete len:385 (+),score=54.20 gnl/TRDRNA2_/TRDRNA2_34811_c0_seq1:217-1371(+)
MHKHASGIVLRKPRSIHSIVVIILCSHIAQACTEHLATNQVYDIQNVIAKNDFGSRLVDKHADSLINRACKATCLSDESLDRTTLWKPAIGEVQKKCEDGGDANLQSTQELKSLAAVHDAWSHIGAVLHWVTKPQQALAQAAVKRLFAFWYARRLLEWRWRGWSPALCVQRLLLHETPGTPTQVVIRPLTKLENRLVFGDCLMATYLSYRTIRSFWLTTTLAESDAPLDQTGISQNVTDVQPGIAWHCVRRMVQHGFFMMPGLGIGAYVGLAVTIIDVFASWDRSWRRTAPVRKLFGTTRHEQLLATYARRYAEKQLQEHVVLYDMHSLLALSWRLGLGAYCCSLERRATPGRLGDKERTAIVVAWTMLAASLKYGKSLSEFEP